tara:strand:- start:2453 stop:2665 length:213 start_codon:yes stop_codon:yes gene_type:complete
MEHLKLIPLYEVNIDFDEASEAWKSNKKSIGNGQYVYICGATLKNGKKCQRKPKKDCTTCFQHKSTSNLL